MYIKVDIDLTSWDDVRGIKYFMSREAGATLDDLNDTQREMLDQFIADAYDATEENPLDAGQLSDILWFSRDEIYAAAGAYELLDPEDADRLYWDTEDPELLEAINKYDSLQMEYLSGETLLELFRQCGNGYALHLFVQKHVRMYDQLDDTEAPELEDADLLAVYRQTRHQPNHEAFTFEMLARHMLKRMLPEDLHEITQDDDVTDADRQSARDELARRQRISADQTTRQAC